MDFTFFCPTEISAFSDRADESSELGAEILGASTDSVFAYGLLIEEEGIALRGLFIIAPDGVLQYSVVNNLNIGRSVDETLRVLAASQSGGLCASDWKPGQKTLGEAGGG